MGIYSRYEQKLSEDLKSKVTDGGKLPVSDAYIGNDQRIAVLKSAKF